MTPDNAPKMIEQRVVGQPMTFDQFREDIRIGCVAGAYDPSFAVQFINRHGWSTTRDVPANKRDYVMRYLMKHANR